MAKYIAKSIVNGVNPMTPKITVFNLEIYDALCDHTKKDFYYYPIQTKPDGTRTISVLGLRDFTLSKQNQRNYLERRKSYYSRGGYGITRVSFRLPTKGR